MYIELNQKEQALLDLLNEIPPNLDGAEHYLKTENLDCTGVGRVAINYVEGCFFEVVDYEHDHHISRPAGILPYQHSSYILDVLKLLLRYGLDPNGFYEDFNIMDSLLCVDNEFLAADALALLLEHGGKPDLMIPYGGETLFESVDFDVFFGAIEMYNRHLYAAHIHFWMVLIGYGARYSEDNMEVFKEYNSSERFSLEKLRNHRNYYFGITRLEKDFAISIYDKDTLWEVARVN